MSDTSGTPSPRHSRTQAAARFLQDLAGRVPTTPVTWALVGLNIWVWLANVMAGLDPLNPDPERLLDWGANYGPATLDGQPWRLLTATVLHAGALHLVLNMWALLDTGRIAERLYGRWRFVLIYGLSGLFASLASLSWTAREAVSVGASGAIFGVVGALAGAMLTRRSGIPQPVRRALLTSLGVFAAYSVILGISIPQVDNAAHAGGAAAGAVIGLLLMRADRPALQALLVMILAVAVGSWTWMRLPAPTWTLAAERQTRVPVEQFLAAENTLARRLRDIGLMGRRGLSAPRAADRIESDVLPEYRSHRAALQAAAPVASLPVQPVWQASVDYLDARIEALELAVQALRTGDPRTSREAQAMSARADFLALQARGIETPQTTAPTGGEPPTGASAGASEAAPDEPAHRSAPGRNLR